MRVSLLPLVCYHHHGDNTMAIMKITSKGETKVFVTRLTFTEMTHLLEIRAKQGSHFAQVLIKSINHGGFSESQLAWAHLLANELNACKSTIRILAQRCDGAKADDEKGYDKIDSKRGKKLASVPFEDWTRGDIAFSRKCANKYKAQLDPDLVAWAKGNIPLTKVSLPDQ